MHGLKVDHRRLKEQPLSRDLAAQLYKTSSYGKIAIVAKSPPALLAATRKQWLRLIRKLQRERSSTLNPTRKEQLEIQLEWMRRLRFTAKQPEDMPEADVTFATADDFVRTPPDCRTIYITYNFEREKLHMLTSWIPRNGVVVIYDQE